MQTTQTRPAPVESRGGRLGTGIAMMFGSGLSTQIGAATGALAFPVIGPTGVVAVRQWVAAVVLLSIGRPRVRSFTWHQWWPVLLLAAVFGSMNLALYSAVDRIGLGLAVTLEFLGPLAVALAGSRRARDLGCALLAGAGVVALTSPEPTTDYPGIALGLLSAVCWACYILLNRTVGRRLPGVEGSATAAGVSGLLFAPIGVAVLVQHPPTVGVLAFATTAGLLSSAVPFLSDLLALRRVPARLFGLFMSINPVLAAACGVIVLGQSLEWGEWLSIGAIVTANALSVASGRRQEDRSPADEPAPGEVHRVPTAPAARSACRRASSPRWVYHGRSGRRRSDDSAGHGSDVLPQPGRGGSRPC